MKSIKILLLALLTIAFFTQSCKKPKKVSDTSTSMDGIDLIAGTYIGKTYAIEEGPVHDYHSSSHIERDTILSTDTVVISKISSDSFSLAYTYSKQYVRDPIKFKYNGSYRYEKIDRTKYADTTDFYIDLIDRNRIQVKFLWVRSGTIKATFSGKK